MKRMILILSILVGMLIAAQPVAAGFTPTPVAPTVAPTVTPIPTGVVSDSSENCAAQLVVELLGDVPEGLVVSGWLGSDSSNQSEPTGSMAFERPWLGQILGIPISPKTTYQVWGWTEQGGWIYFFEVTAGGCVDVLGQHAFYTATSTATPVLAPTPAELPETGGMAPSIPWGQIALAVTGVGVLWQGIASGTLLPNRRSKRSERYRDQ